MTDVENENIKGFVNLQAINAKEFETLSLANLLDENGFIKRSETSNQFHKYIQQALNDENAWRGTRFFCFWGNTDIQGECFNIGQLHLVWYGPYLKRAVVSVDIAPIIRITDWIPKNWSRTHTLVAESTAKSVGCYLMMKDAKRYVEGLDFVNEMEAGVAKVWENRLFKVSISQVEHAAMRFAPADAKNGYKIAKSIQMLCPHLLFDAIKTMELSKEMVRRAEYGPDGSILALFKVSEFVTSYVLKTGLFFELERRGMVSQFSAEDMMPRKWNHTILTGDVFDQTMPTKDDVHESVLWALSIYKKILTLVVEQKHVPEFFLTQMEATKIPGYSDEFVLVMSTFLKCIIHILENYAIPDDIWK